MNRKKTKRCKNGMKRNETEHTKQHDIECVKTWDDSMPGRVENGNAEEEGRNEGGKKGVAIWRYVRLGGALKRRYKAGLTPINVRG